MVPALVGATPIGGAGKCNRSDSVRSNFSHHRGIRANSQGESMSGFDDRPTSNGRSRSREVLCLVLCAGFPAFGYGDLSAQSPAPDSVAHQESDVHQDSVAHENSVAHQDSVVYRLLADSRFEVTTTKAGLFGFAGHTHMVRAQAFSGSVVYYPSDPASSHLDMTILTDSLEVLTPPDTAEIRQVTETMRAKVLRVSDYPEIRFTATGDPTVKNKMRLQGEMTLVGRTRAVPVDAAIQLGPDSIRASGTFSVKQTDFGIKPYSGGPAGTVKVGDRLMFAFDAIAVRTDTSVSVRATEPDPPHR
jgi:polyisoprenoid-binding protein YceI